MFGKKKDASLASEIESPANVSINELNEDEALSDDELSLSNSQPQVSEGNAGNQNGEGSSSVKRKKTEDPKKKPLLAEVKRLAPTKWICNHCKEKFTSTYTRIHAHFFGVPNGKSLGIKRCKVISGDALKFQALMARVKAAEAGGVSAELTSSLIGQRNHLVGVAKMKECFGMVERDAVDQAIMRFFCANGIAFNAIRSPQFSEMISAINRGPKDYKGPSYEKARTTLLDECKRNVEEELSPIQHTWHSQGLSIVSDGWTNVNNRPLINVIAENSRGALFMYGTDFSGVEKTGLAIADYLIKSIDLVGPSNVVQVVTDNASNCKLAGKEIQKAYKHIFWSPCVVHTLNLVFKEFGESFSWLKDAYTKGKAIVQFIVHHQQPLALFRSESNLELLKVATTRFATHYILLKRLLDCRDSLVTVVCLTKWRDWFKRLDESTRTVGDEVTKNVKDDTFWEEVEGCLAVLAPIYKVLRFADGEGILMGEIYERMDTMLGELKDIMRPGGAGHRYSEHFDTM